MTNLIPDPTYKTFKNAVLNRYMSGKISPADISQKFLVPPNVAKAWLSRYDNELQYAEEYAKEIASETEESIDINDLPLKINVTKI